MSCTFSHLNTEVKEDSIRMGDHLESSGAACIGLDIVVGGKWTVSNTGRW